MSVIEYTERSAEELADYYHSLLRISDDLEEERKTGVNTDLYNPDGTGRVQFSLFRDT